MHQSCRGNRNPLLRNLLFFRVFFLAAVLTACGATWSGCNRNAAASRYDLTGKVVSVDRELKKVTIAHDEIPGFMSAMTMPFVLKEEWAYGVLGPGDQVKGTLVVSGDRSWLEDLVITQEGAPDATAVPEPANEPKPGDKVPEFVLTNQEGHRVGLGEFLGRALVVTFIYTRCPLPDYCPLMNTNFQELQTELLKQPELIGRTQLLTISFDPEYDTPEVLKTYARSFTPNFDHWQFATGSSSEVKTVAEYFGLRYWPENDQIIHSLRTAVIGPDGKLINLYRGNEWKVSEVLGDLQKLNLARLAR
ncbi:MAG: SCO family protein [Acidobacteria bacterium]|nr:SCO family protein [Acidobacteriota bacterium]